MGALPCLKDGGIYIQVKAALDLERVVLAEKFFNITAENGETVVRAEGVEPSRAV